MAETSGPILTISELADELGVTARTIRYYEEVGLIEPIRHEDIAQRLYGARERGRLKLILRGKRLGFSLTQIKEMIDLYNADPTEREQLQRTIAYGEQRLAEIDELLQDLQVMREEIMDYHNKFVERLKKL
ncbi:MerR family DNA-binding transcriptional regulator [Desulfosporosinus sp.]|uniref:MerR family transcriptional regulator n=1 Tax=Desulfosporosinus sp. TaxID=157907 RepID=UPI000E9EA63D|nr:MerR family DNA-binding transcriptional regulator [Desulfosporosinus sp.]MBC2723560.1 MerR family DNA-binding transcriptional regulator [Desulfosporosinus sp.]MBC2726151.1 MerR family DNA-binding transcriptional regulator [Desulfosporosinus sp.]HBV88578.1 transcriptional regulator [Desulfosporosinus sp.]